MNIADQAFRRGGAEPAGITRRGFLHGLAATAAMAVPGLAAAQTPIEGGDHGRIRPPVPVPDVGLLRYDGARTTLPLLAQGRASAVQLMFTECTTTCPIEAAIFHRVQDMLPEMAVQGLQLLSLSVNPGADTPRALASWRRRFHAGPEWIAAAPRAADSAAIQSFFGKASGSFADHSTRVSILDRQGRLVWRTVELPAAEEVASILRRV
jgi:protein SCO1/2